jgi:hypothetical protein
LPRSADDKESMVLSFMLITLMGVGKITRGYFRTIDQNQWKLWGPNNWGRTIWPKPAIDIRMV